MDIDVTQKPDGTTWSLTDLLGRDMGYIADRATGEFMIYPAGHALHTMEAMRRGPFKSLDDALAEIERFTRGTCRRPSADEGPAAGG
ncbi:hypothetical protein ASE66_18435 [Bosea sp. Root483D1]|uniref:hypothetical protein n=1 Tax=Bosea sp. Root483D1 TaxID=1736544 RepID=UPI00070ACA00|nr:hypothetical protein [Bosea sp. Root483D1]KRE12511.1 hypothetical protein ASE66_18435 [Bosea sp. Root483D1]